MHIAGPVTTTTQAVQCGVGGRRSGAGRTNDLLVCDAFEHDQQPTSISISVARFW
jgi:hypothetical protein